MTPEQRQFLMDLDQDGEQSPDGVVEAARPESSPIHSLIPWDDAELGNKARLEVARKLLGRIRVEYVHHVREIRQPVYIRNPNLPHREAGYIKVSLLRTNEESAQMALRAEISQVAARIERVRAIARGLNLEDECETQLRALILEAAELAS